jgi:hypothetical protein
VIKGEEPERVKLFSYCVAGRPALVQLDRSTGEWAMRIKPISQENAERPIVAKTVDQILEDAKVADHTLDIFKCDIEGAEAELFSSPGSWLSRTICLAVETHAPYYDWPYRGFKTFFE